jgi:hypothetical protein
MTQAVVVRRDGDTFQARWFWTKAAGLLDPESPVLKVGFESGPKSFDDVWVEYDPARAPKDQNGLPLLREHVQCKWHVTPSTFGYADLVNPEFINASSQSLLSRARAAQQTFAPAGEGSRFRLLTNWQISVGDALRKLISTRSTTVRLDELFSTKTDNSIMGQVRRLWREHLDIDDDELRVFVRTLAVATAHESLDDLRVSLDLAFRVVGLRRVPLAQSAFVYDDIPFQWLAQGKKEFDRQTFKQVCEAENLLDTGSTRPRVFGIKSFEHPIDKLEERCTEVLDLVPMFDERYIRSEADWSTSLYPSLKTFLLSAAKNAERVRLVLDTHLTLSFAAGSVLDLKSGRMVEIEQRTLGRSVWAADDIDHDPAWPQFRFNVKTLNDHGSDVVVAVGLTHSIGGVVEKYVERELPQVAALLHAEPSSGVSARAIACGRHAFELAEELAAKIKELQSSAARPTTMHLFLASPGAFAFLLGQRRPALGTVVLYEYDFEGSRGGSYAPSLALPVR